MIDSYPTPLATSRLFAFLVNVVEQIRSTTLLSRTPRSINKIMSSPGRRFTEINNNRDTIELETVG